VEDQVGCMRGGAIGKVGRSITRHPLFQRTVQPPADDRQGAAGLAESTLRGCP